MAGAHSALARRSRSVSLRLLLTAERICDRCYPPSRRRCRFRRVAYSGCEFPRDSLSPLPAHHAEYRLCSDGRIPRCLSHAECTLDTAPCVRHMEACPRGDSAAAHTGVPHPHADAGRVDVPHAPLSGMRGNHARHVCHAPPPQNSLGEGGRKTELFLCTHGNAVFFLDPLSPHSDCDPHRKYALPLLHREKAQCPHHCWHCGADCYALDRRVFPGELSGGLPLEYLFAPHSPGHAPQHTHRSREAPLAISSCGTHHSCGGIPAHFCAEEGAAHIHPPLCIPGRSFHNRLSSRRAPHTPRRVRALQCAARSAPCDRHGRSCITDDSPSPLAEHSAHRTLRHCTPCSHSFRFSLFYTGDSYPYTGGYPLLPNRRGSRDSSAARGTGHSAAHKKYRCPATGRRLSRSLRRERSSLSA